MSDIKCTVSECTYNSNLACNAPMIEIAHNNIDRASKSDQTKCETFKKK
ncbi:MAG: DUF1540 domain-containing protein [Pelotomaculum sp.]|uniref:DUF1540 domain-containing protein n=1 Tax=Pelotomaculum thermopropionicum (strain DSM 13744 / JCM 10971 / SI) TaxID=370438 RepID=A5D3J8_PELTS|nr:DUF1540 domain-containing protein [Pelotomaculum sp.]BAF59171.1 hypothetical protein PTH_0990 [Pelotomaculum thermopropionicum SI]